MKKSTKSLLVSAAIIAPGAAAWCGCGRDAQLAGENVRHATVRTVSHYGVTLDRNATPEQVAFVALRAIRDDFLADTRADREAAIDKQFDVCAAEVIASRNRTALSRDEMVYHVVTEWTPTVSYYVGDFETEADKAVARLVNHGTTNPVGNGAAECELAMEVADPAGDPNARAVLLIWLAEDGGYWRVMHFGFEQKRSLRSANRLISPGETLALHDSAGIAFGAPGASPVT